GYGDIGGGSRRMEVRRRCTPFFKSISRPTRGDAARAGPWLDPWRLRTVHGGAIRGSSVARVSIEGCINGISEGLDHTESEQRHSVTSASFALAIHHT